MVQVYGAPERAETTLRQSRISQKQLTWGAFDNALIPPSVQVDIPFEGDHVFPGWKGGVYDRAGTVQPGSLIDRHWTRVSVAYEPEEMLASEARRVAGEAVYCGLLFHHFGHFLLESTCRLWWPLQVGFSGQLVFQNTRPRLPIPDFITSFFKLLGVSERVVVVDTPLAFDRVIIPEPAFKIQSFLNPEFLLPFARVGAAVEHRHASPSFWTNRAVGVYLSRTRFSRRRAFGERQLEAIFSANDYDVLHMQELPLHQQILAVRRYETIAGIAGSAFHNVLFSSEPRACLYICKDHDINVNFSMIDEAMGNTSTYIYSGDPEQAAEPLPHAEMLDRYLDDTTLDVQKVRSLLIKAGSLPRASSRWSAGQPGTGLGRRSS